MTVDKGKGSEIVSVVWLLLFLIYTTGSHGSPAQQVEVPDTGDFLSLEEVEAAQAAEYGESQQSSIPMDDIVDDREDHENHPTEGLQKRFIENPDTLWKNGIIPYIYTTSLNSDDINEVEKAMRFITENTCIDFVHYSSATQQSYKLRNDSYIRMTHYHGRCQCFMGDHGHPFDCTCCGGMTCVHELGHAIGLNHQQQSPLRYDWIRMNPANMSGDSGSYLGLTTGNRVFYGFDINSPMTYSETHSGKLVYTLLDPERARNLKKGVFYFFKAISSAYRCEGLVTKVGVCRSVSMRCENGGYLTRINGRCQCHCLGRLDPATGCTTMIFNYSAPVEFPGGNYAFLMPKTGCPGGSTQFKTGQLTHYFYKTWFLGPMVLQGHYGGVMAEQHFCVRQSPDNGLLWPPGEYCILRSGGSCPAGFDEESYIQFDNQVQTTNHSNHWSGALPDGQYGDNIRLQFCCRHDGFREQEPLILPNKQPFTTFQYAYAGCPEVRGMKRTSGTYMMVQNQPGHKGTEVPRPPYTYYVGSSGTMYWNYCHYYPQKTDCGGILELTRNRRSATFTSPNYPATYDNYLECQWFIKAPENSTLTLTATDFEIEGKDGNLDCDDQFLVSYARVGQPPLTYCGSFLRTIRSLSNYMIVTLTTDHNGQRKGFNATVHLVLDTDLCYDPDDHGVNYRGTANYTRHFEPCLPWAEVTHCQHSAFYGGDYYDGLDENYCRNPGDGLSPWCYTQKEHCVRNYCDVCQLEPAYDKYDNCDELLAEGQCSDQYLARKGCSHTCHSHLVRPETPVAYVNQRCSAPPTPPDAAPAPPQHSPTSYRVGDEVVFHCLSANYSGTTRCLSDGTWSPIGYVCGGCPPGWTSFGEKCYMAFYESQVYNDAKSLCHQHGASLVTPRSPQEATFLVNLRRDLASFWIGLKEVTQGQWRWENGTALTGNNWADGHPRQNTELDCALMDIHNHWTEAAHCYFHYQVVCQLNPSDAARKTCTDRRTDCPDMLIKSPTLCQEQKDWSWMMCPHTCGLCPNAIGCIVPAASTNATRSSVSGYLRLGELATYACKDGHLPVSGDDVRACLPSGLLTGANLVCRAAAETFTVSSDVSLIDREHVGEAKVAYTGPAANLKMSRDGYIHAWRFFSRTRTTVTFQVYRPTAHLGTQQYELVGENTVQTKANRIQHVDVEEGTRVHVQPGDLLGIYYHEDPTSVPFENCTEYSFPGGEGVVRSTSTLEGASHHIGGAAIQFDNNPTCLLFSFTAVIGGSVHMGGMPLIG